MSLLNKVVSSPPGICGVELDFDGYTVASTIDGFQPFNNSIPVNSAAVPAYYSSSSISFNEESGKNGSGTFYKQKVTFRFPSTDKDRSVRLEMFKRLKYVIIKLTNGQAIVIGRNDYNQNARPDVKIGGNEKLTVVEITADSIFSAGFIPTVAQFQLPAFIPVPL